MITFDAASHGDGLTGSTITWSHTVGSGSNRILIAGVTSNNADLQTGATYNGVAMTLGKKSSFTGPTMYLFYLLNPDSGAHDIATTGSGSEVLRAASASYAGVKQSGQPDASDDQAETSTSITSSLTQVVNNAWQVGLAHNGAVGTLSGAAGLTFRDGANTTVTSIGDSNATTGAGTRTLTWNNTSSTNLWALQFSLADINQSVSTFLSLL